MFFFFFFFQAEDGIRDPLVTGVQTCALPIYPARAVAVASLAPVAFIGVLYVLTRVSVRRYEAFPVSARRPGQVDLPRARLVDEQFWSGAAYANLSRWLHLISSVVLVGWLLTAV